MSQKIVFNVAKLGFNFTINGFLRFHKNGFDYHKKLSFSFQKTSFVNVPKKAFSCPKN